VWYTDAFGWPITARPLSSTGTLERVEVSEVLNKMVQRACEFEPVKKLTTMPTTTASVTASTTTTASTFSAKSRFKDDASSMEEAKEILAERVAPSFSYPDLVSFCFLFYRSIINNATIAF